MLNLFIVTSLLAAISIVVMSGAISGSVPIIMELASVVFAMSTGISALAFAAIEG